MTHDIGKLIERVDRDLVCVRCDSGEHLAEDSLCVWCTNCGPSYPIMPRSSSSRLRALPPSSSLEDQQKAAATPTIADPDGESGR